MGAPGHRRTHPLGLYTTDLFTFRDHLRAQVDSYLVPLG